MKPKSEMQPQSQHTVPQMCRTQSKVTHHSKHQGKLSLCEDTQSTDANTKVTQCWDYLTRILK